MECRNFSIVRKRNTDVRNAVEQSVFIQIGVTVVLHLNEMNEFHDPLSPLLLVELEL
jgi:hypothetical protein